mgnify:CR=1 FL=1
MAQDNIKFEQGAIPAKKKKSPVFYVVVAVAVLGAAFFGVREYQYSQTHEETDDAQIEKNMTPIIPRVAGYISKVYVKDNDFVKKGDTLFTIDKKDFQVKIEEAKAALIGAEGGSAGKRTDQDIYER